jgi:protein gp37
MKKQQMQAMFVLTDKPIVGLNPKELTDHKLNLEIFSLLSDTQYQELKEDIKNRGIQDPLHVRKIDTNVFQVICGHQRKNIAIELGLSTVPCIVRDDLKEEWQVEEVLIRDNLNRRQLDDPGIAKASEYLLVIEEAKAKQRMSEGGKKKGVENFPYLTDTGTSRDKVAEQLGVSGRQLDKIKFVDKKAPEKLKKEWKNGKISTSKAYNEIKDIEKESVDKSVSTFNRTNDNIEWAIWTWNPVTGCKHGCSYCYARDIANRFYKEKFEPTLHSNRFDAPKNTKISEKDKKIPGCHNVFVCSMADLFGEWVSKEWIDKTLKVVKDNPEWNFLFLTKNPKRLLKFAFPKNSWVGATIDIQSRVKLTEDVFKKLKATVKFVSCEPLREKITFKDISIFDWLIIGGQSESSGEPAKQPEWEWVEHLLNQARKKDIKIYFKPNLTIRPKEYPICQK